MENKDKIVVEVRYCKDDQGAFLTVEPTDFALGCGQCVVWKFLDVPSDLAFVPTLRFEPRLGPFHVLRTAPDLPGVVGKGNTGKKGQYTYFATIVFGPPKTPEIVSSRASATVDNRATHVDTTPEVRVRYVPGKDGGKGHLHAEPHVLQLSDGDSPFWTFYDLPAEGSVYLYAPESPEGARHPLIGPFQSLTSLRSAGGDPRVSQFIVATGQGQSPPGLYVYHLELVGAGGETLAIGDPVIDNGGPPG